MNAVQCIIKMKNESPDFTFSRNEHVHLHSDPHTHSHVTETSSRSQRWHQCGCWRQRQKKKSVKFLARTRWFVWSEYSNDIRRTVGILHFHIELRCVCRMRSDRFSNRISMIIIIMTHQATATANIKHSQFTRRLIELISYNVSVAHMRMENTLRMLQFHSDSAFS